MRTATALLVAASCLAGLCLGGCKSTQPARKISARPVGAYRDTPRSADRKRGARPEPTTTHHSSDFGWEAGQDVTKEFAGLFRSGKLKAGDEFVLDHKYRISGSHTLPDNFTLTAAKGAGFDVTDAENRRHFLVLGNSNTLYNLTITYLNTPELGGRSIEHGVDFFDKKGINASGKSDILLENCRLEGMIANHIVAKGCKRARFIGCHIIGGFWAVIVGGTDLLFRRCLFEKSSSDGIKGGADGALIENCVFQDNGRDAIDTTGGLNDTIIRNCTFRRLGREGLDLKSFYQGKNSVSRPENVGILVDKCLFHDMSNAIVLSTVDDGRRKGQGNELLTAANIKELAPHDIDINDCVFGHAETPLRPWKDGGYGVNYPSPAGEYMRMIYLKDAHSIRYRNARLSGDRIRPVYVNSIGGSRHLSKEAAQALDHSIAGNVLDEPAPPIKPGQTEAPFACGPQPLK